MTTAFLCIAAVLNSGTGRLYFGGKLMNASCVCCDMSAHYASVASALFAAAVAAGSAAWVVCTRPAPPRARATSTYYQAPGGKKLHSVRECRALTNVADVAIQELDTEAVKVLYRVGGLCVRCAAPHGEGI